MKTQTPTAAIQERNEFLREQLPVVAEQNCGCRVGSSGNFSEVRNLDFM